MKSGSRGKSTSAVEVTHISKHGFWLLLKNGETFLSFETFPWFREATVGQLHNVVLLNPLHLHWPDLDVDLTLESILHPERFPLVSRGPVRSRPRRPSGAGRVADKPPGSHPRKTAKGMR